MASTPSENSVPIGTDLPGLFSKNMSFLPSTEEGGGIRVTPKMVNAPLNPAKFCQSVLRTLRRKRFTIGHKDCVNQIVFTKRKKLDPNFQIPQAHINKWQPVPIDQLSDDEPDPDEGESRIPFRAYFTERSNMNLEYHLLPDTLPVEEQNEWLDSTMVHVEAMLTALTDDTQRKAFAIKFADIVTLTRRKKRRLKLL